MSTPDPARSTAEDHQTSVVGSSTFRHALGVTLSAWALAALGAWAAFHHVPADDPEEIREEVRITAEETFAVLAATAAELEVERREELDDEEADDEEADDEEADDEEADDEETGWQDDEEIEARFGARFEAAEWTGERVLDLFLDEEGLWEDLGEAGVCWQLVDRHGHWQIGNLFSNPGADIAVDGPFLRVPGAEVEIPPQDLEEPDELRAEWRERLVEEPMECRVVEQTLGDGAQLRIGRHAEPVVIGASLAASLALLLLGLAVAVGGSWLQARRTVRFVADLRSARARLEGDAFPRLRRPGDGGDFDRAAGEINGILDRLDSALGSLTHVTDNIAHDLRTPLTRLQGQLDVVRRSGQPSEAMLAAVQEEADQLVATFNALLRIAQVESGSRRRGFRPFDLARVVADVGELYAPAFGDAELDFELREPGAPVRLQGDPDLWMQALSNLLDNALKYTPAGGSVRLDLVAGPPPRIVLRDTGPGIPEDEHAKVFERFYRSDRQRRAGSRGAGSRGAGSRGAGSRGAGSRGAGLGLSLVAAICELHGATIRLENDDGLVVRIALRR